MTFQMLIRKEEERLQTNMSECLSDLAEWRTRLNSLAFKGITQEHLNHWVWILEGQDADTRIQRFVSTEIHKPIFLLLQLLRKDETFHKGSSVMALINYTARYHVRWRTPLAGDDLPFGSIRRTLDPRLNMTTKHFALVLRLIVHHVLRVWPSAIPAVARLVASYIESIRPGGKNAPGVMTQQSFIFNYALQLFQQKSPLSPVSQMKYNWKAQKILLTLSTGMRQPIPIARQSYRAIRRVMLALPKSESENRSAVRLAKTWPPYRQAWDGLDQKRRPEDNLSRTVKAGFVLRESGFPDEEQDRTLAVLGGASPEEAPTIQTRSLSPRTWTGRYASLNIYSTWAARVRATRNAHEAWRMLKTPPLEGIRPNFQVYAEMFEKLSAAVVRPQSAALPGDGREVFPFHDANLSAFEKARLKPPSAAEVYRQMLQDGNRPVGKCLAVLVRHASTLPEAIQYLRDSPLDKAAVSILVSTDELSPFDASPSAMLRKIPLQIFDAYVSLLCHLQPRIGIERTTKEKWARIPYLRRAIQLAGLRLSPDTSEGRTCKGPWHTILRTLAAPKVLLDEGGARSKRSNDLQCLAFFLKVFTRVKKLMGLDVVLFESLCNAILKVANTGNFRNTTVASAMDPRLVSRAEALEPEELVSCAYAILLASFRELTATSHPPSSSSEATGADAAEQLEFPSLYHEIGAVHLQAYIRALGFLGDIDEMVRVMRWMLDAWEDPSLLPTARDPAHAHHAMLMRAFTFFRAFAENALSVDTMRQLEDRAHELNDRHGCTWLWPTSEDVDRYVRYDERQARFWDGVRSG